MTVRLCTDSSYLPGMSLQRVMAQQWSALAFTAVTVWTIVFGHFALVTGVLYGSAHGNFCVNALFSSQFLCCPFAWNILDGDTLHNSRRRSFKRVSPHHFLEVCLEPMFAHRKAHDVCVKEWLSFVKLELCDLFRWNKCCYPFWTHQKCVLGSLDPYCV